MTTIPATRERVRALHPLLAFFAPAPFISPLKEQGTIDRLYKKKRMVIMTALTLGYALAYTCRLGLSVVKKPLLDGGLFSASELGLVGSTFLFAYGAGKLVNGILADHANLKRVLPAALLVSALVNLAMGVKAALVLWCVFWALNGWFQGFLAPGSVVSLAAWFSNHERGRMYGIWSTAHSLGEGLTFIATAALVGLVGWRGGFAGPGMLCIAGAIALYLALEDRPESLGLPNVADWKNDHAPRDLSHAETSTLRVQMQALLLPAVWVIGLASSACYVTRYALNNWGILYLQEAKGYSLLEAGSLLGVSTFAGVAGCIAFGFISDTLFDARRPPVNLIFGVIELVGLGLLVWLPAKTPLLTGVAFALYGFGLNGLITSLGGLFAVDLAPKRSTGAVMGMVGMFSYLGATIQDALSGYLIDRGTTMVDGTRHYDFGPALWMWIGASVLSLFLALTLWRAKPID
jgi:MFS transporter, OPA family, sugar phosphate sensor protein UhpC